MTILPDPVAWLKETVADLPGNEGVDLGQVVECICQTRHDMARISVSVQTGKALSAQPLGNASGSARNAATNEAESAMSPGGPTFFLNQELHAQKLKKLQALGRSLRVKYQEARRIGIKTLGQLLGVSGSEANEISTILITKMETDVGEADELHRTFIEHEDYMEQLSELGNTTVEDETGLQVAPRLYKFSRYIELRSFQTILAARSEGAQTWTFREWKRT